MRCALLHCPLRQDRFARMATMRAQKCAVKRWRTPDRYEPTFPFRLKPEFRKQKPLDDPLNHKPLGDT